jgi:hypothetical protein
MEAARRRPDALDLAVESLAHRVGDWMPPPSHHVAESALDYPRDLLHRLELTLDGGPVKFTEVFRRVVGSFSKRPRRSGKLP